jgi:HD-GYP domain-containing protein (c-di-GMP phosphodiesterase class II)
LGARLCVQAQIGLAGQPRGRLNVFTFGSEQRRSSDEQALLQAMADQAAQVIDRLRLAALAARRLEFAQGIQTMDLAITTSQDLHVMLKVCLQQITNFLKVDAADVRLLNSNVLQFVVGRGLRTTVWQHAAPRLGEGPSGRAALEGHMHQVLDLQLEPQAQVLVTAERFASAIAVPLIVRWRTLGVLEVFNRSPLDPDAEWLECLQAQARQVAIGVDQATLYAGLERARVELTMSNDETIECWLRALELRDGARPAAEKHLAELSVMLAEAAGIPADGLLAVRRGALLHDVGILCLPEGLLRKPGPLTSAETKAMRRHPELARELLSSNGHLRRALEIPEYHHEKWDGSGYPHGLRGERIPVAARVFAVVDVWEALRANRPHRPAWSDKQALAHIISQSGLHFDPRIVDLFRDLQADGRLASA